MTAAVSRRQSEPPPLPAGPITSIVPPAPIAPGLLEQIEALAVSIAQNEARVGPLSLAELQGEAGATERLAELEASIAAAKADHVRKTATWKAALAADRAALEAHQAWIRTLPTATLIAGITAKKCADLCHEHGCAIAGGTIPCMHPKVAVPPKHAGDRFITSNRHAASQEIVRQREAEEANQ